MANLSLVPVDSVECRAELDLRQFVDIAKKILECGGLEEPIVVEKRRVVNAELCTVLKKLGAKLIPVAEKKIRVFIPLEALGFYSDIEPKRLRVFSDTIELLYGNWPTPLVVLKSLSRRSVRVWAKLEFFNPFSNSIKDRVAWYMFKRWIEERGPIKKLYEASSGNTGIALAAIAAAYGAKARIYLPSAAPKATEILLQVLGAEVVRSSKSLTVEMMEDVKRDAVRDGVVNLDQLNNDANFEVHLRYTAKELDLQLREAGIVPRAIIVGTGTSGHISALALYFKSRYRGSVKVFGVQPAPGHSIPGLRRIETGVKWLYFVDIDDVLDITLEEAIENAVEIARKEGLIIGISSGAVVAGFRKLLECGALEGDVILVFPDSGFKYVELFEKYLAEKEA